MSCCCDAWDLTDDGDTINGTCPECGMPTVDGQAWTGCNYSPVDCQVCGSATCDQSC